MVDLLREVVWLVCMVYAWTWVWGEGGYVLVEWVGYFFGGRNGRGFFGFWEELVVEGWFYSFYGSSFLFRRGKGESRAKLKRL